MKFSTLIFPFSNLFSFRVRVASTILRPLTVLVFVFLFREELFRCWCRKRTKQKYKKFTSDCFVGEKLNYFSSYFLFLFIIKILKIFLSFLLFRFSLFHSRNFYEFIFAFTTFCFAFGK